MEHTEAVWTFVYIIQIFGPLEKGFKTLNTSFWQSKFMYYTTIYQIFLVENIFVVFRLKGNVPIMVDNNYQCDIYFIHMPTNIEYAWHQITTQPPPPPHKENQSRFQTERNINRGRILGCNWDKSLTSFPPCFSQSPLLTNFAPRPPFWAKVV